MAPLSNLISASDSGRPQIITQRVSPRLPTTDGEKQSSPPEPTPAEGQSLSRTLEATRCTLRAGLVWGGAGPATRTPGLLPGRCLLTPGKDRTYGDRITRTNTERDKKPVN